jgi:peroxiredoxin
VGERDGVGPEPGELPPDFSLKRKGSDERVRLSTYRGKRPVALIFGSYT